jgi:hypothetical protein
MVKYACEYIVSDFICELSVAIDRLPTKGNLFGGLFSLMRNSAEKRVNIFELIFVDESVACPVQSCTAVINAFSVLPFVH